MQPETIYTVTTWIIPLLTAITLHEAAHGYVARALGDQTAAKLGRVTLNPIKHIDPFGTIILPGLLLLARSPFLFGYARPVPVNFRALRNGRRGMVMVAAAGPLMNIVLALISALGFRLVPYLPSNTILWTAQNLKNALILNVTLAVFNLFPLPPLDGGRIAVGLLPNFIAVPFSKLEPFGMTILIGLLFVLPMIGPTVGLDLGFVSRFISWASQQVLRLIVGLTGLR